MSLDPDRTPVIIGVGEVNDRQPPSEPVVDSLALMRAALAEAERDSGAPVLDRLDWLGVVDQISFPDPELHERLARALSDYPATARRTDEPSGAGPGLLINQAANAIASGAASLAAAVGAEAMRTAMQLARSAPTPVAGGLALATEALALPLWRKYGLINPIDVYPLYENASRAAWGQSLAEAQAETAAIWSAFSRVAADNPGAWMRDPVGADAILAQTRDNRMISFPYSKLMVANSNVNQGAAVILASLARARAMGVAEERLVHVGAGAAASEPFDFLKRDSYAGVASLAATVTECLRLNDLEPEALDAVELYSCFPCVPKMARRALGGPATRPLSVYGGLTFGGGPIANPMMHAAAVMVRKLREGAATGLIVANGGYATHSHSIVLSRGPTRAKLPAAYDVQAAADALRGAEPELLDSHVGPGRIETYAIPFDRMGAPDHATVVARTPAGERFLALVPGTDAAGLALLTSGLVEAVGTEGSAFRREDGGIVWESRP